jgi:hypothetical protein
LKVIGAKRLPIHVFARAPPGIAASRTTDASHSHLVSHPAKLHLKGQLDASKTYLRHYRTFRFHRTRIAQAISAHLTCIPCPSTLDVARSSRFAPGQALRTGVEISVAFRSAKDAAFAERKATKRQLLTQTVNAPTAPAAVERCLATTLASPATFLRRPSRAARPARRAGRAAREGRRKWGIAVAGSGQTHVPPAQGRRGRLQFEWLDGVFALGRGACGDFRVTPGDFAGRPFGIRP